MKQFLLLFRGRDTDPQASPEEMQAQMQKWFTWIGGLAEEKKYVTGNPLEDSGKTVSGTRKVVTDGPFAEGKEMLGGYILIKVENYDEAVAIANNCPILDSDTGSVEVREVRVIPDP
ncbi:MAG: hypothetical protein JSS63_13430 [Bacteroidetes bacterium]|nr:hypothetical protein [Bacteroidota bacterium]